ncbi:helix-turn-helix domain-containing protein [Haladaptatus pallidirubidus]|uniref:HTH DNA binding domain-containing protein n=1 Tax=Haladaptatus pallidirubidus TaxID=1008152 RepID=A0AAV3UJP1_9EURY|nr:helix-turn-helix domain-containing protein [Haladaptatus pallidirubidus]
MTYHSNSQDQKVDESEKGGQTQGPRYATVLLELDEEHESSDDDIAPGRSAVTRRQLHHFNLVDDETVVLLYHFQGDLDQIETVLDAAPDVLNYGLVDQGEGGGFAYIHCELDDPVRSIVSTLHLFEVVLDMPLEFTTDGSVKATLIGEEPALGEALEAISGIVNIHLEKTGTYRPGARDLGATLTDRQYQILTVAVREGYYEVPRGSTLEDVAAEIDLSRATVGEHLQKIEAKVLSRIVQ